MKKTEFKELKTLKPDDLTKRALILSKELANLVMDQHSESNSKGNSDVKLVYKKRKDIARILTIIRQKELLGEIETKVKGKGESVKGEVVKEEKAENSKSARKEKKG